MIQNPGKFMDLLSQPGDPEVLQRINSNINEHVVYINILQDSNAPYSPILRDALYKVIKAYSIFNPVEGYYPALGQIALVLVSFKTSLFYTYRNFYLFIYNIYINSIQ